MKRTVARARTVSTRRTVVMTGLAVIGLAGAGSGIPAVMAGLRSVPASAAPQDWPAAKAARMRAEDQLRQAAASRPLLPPPALPSAERPRSTGIRWQSAGRSGPEGGAVARAPASAGQAALTEGIVPLAEGGPFSPSQFLGTNLWNGRAGARWEVVQAGGVPADRALGAASPAASAGLFVYTRSPDPASVSAPRVIGIRAPSPDPRGMFTIEAVHGQVLTLSLPASRRQYRFNVVTLRFT